jgi:transposase InsO family protein
VSGLSQVPEGVKHPTQAFDLQSCGRWMSLTFPPLAHCLLGWQCYVHVSVDSYSDYIYASMHSGEATKHVIAHCLAAFTTMGKPQQLKTNNGPTYTSAAFQRFCQAYQIHHTTSIPYNPQGLAIVECAHATLKMQLKKLKGRDEVLLPASQLHKALYTLNFFNCPEQCLTPTERHWQLQELIVGSQVLWKNVLTGK